MRLCGYVVAFLRVRLMATDMPIGKQGRAGNSVLTETYLRASLSPHATSSVDAHHRALVAGELMRWKAEHTNLGSAIDACRAHLTDLGTGLPAFEPATRSALLLAAESALGRCALDEGTHIAQQLRAQSPVDAVPAEYLYARQLEARALLLRDRPAEAAELYAQAERTIRRQWPHRSDLRLCLAHFSLELASSCARAGHPAAALPVVLHALAVAGTAQVRGVLHMEATLALVEVMLLMDIKGSFSFAFSPSLALTPRASPGKCRALVEDVLPQALQHGGHRLVARTWLTLARATLAEGADSGRLAAALQQLSYALTAATQAMDDTLRAEVHYLRARLLHQLGKHEVCALAVLHFDR